MSIDIINPDTLVTSFVNIFTIDHILAFLTLVFTYTGINGIVIMDRNKYLNLLKSNFPELKAFSDKLFRYKLFIRVSPLIIFPFGILISFSYFSIMFLLFGIIDGFFFNGKISSVFDFSDIWGGMFTFSVLILILFCFIIFKLFKNKKFLPQKDNISGKGLSLIISYLFFWFYLTILVSPNILFHVFIYPQSIIPILINEQDYNKNLILISFTIIITGFFLMEPIKIISWFRNKYPNMLIDSYKFVFPPIRVKTSAGEVIGSIKNLYHPNFLTLIEGDVLRFIPWSEVKVIEFCCNNQDITPEAIEAPAEKKKPFWKFW